MSGFRAFLAKEKELTQKALVQFVELQIERYSDIDADLTSMLGYFLDYIRTGGKWARPTLTRLAYDYLEGDSVDQRALILSSAAVELFHRFILAHDDIVDRDLTRHGMPTLEQSFMDEVDDSFVSPVQMHGMGMAMIAGDILHSWVNELLMSTNMDASKQLQLMQGFQQCLMETAAGWRKETLLKQYAIENVSEAAILTAMQLVSAHYSVLWPLRVGQLLAGSRFGSWDAALEHYGTHVGMAFQMQDDILGMFGDSEKTGKPVGADYREGKKTLLIWHAYRHGSERDKAFLNKTLGNTEDEAVITQAQALLMRLGSVDYVQNKARRYAELGMVDIDDSKPRARRLIELADYLIRRSA